MGKYQGNVFPENRYSLMIAAWLLAIAGVGLAMWPIIAMAQTGCVGDPCVFYTPTGTDTPTPTTEPLSGTPTAVPMPTAIPFPETDFNQPTAIPGVTFPDVPAPYQPTLDPLPSPLVVTPPPIPSVISPDSVSFTNTSSISLSEISSTISVSFSAISGISTTGEGGITGSMVYSMITGVIGTGQGIISGVTSYTTYISGQMASLQYTETFTVSTAPTWYAPAMPREYANLGWTFELMNGDMYGVKKYSVGTWAYIFGYMVSMPVKLGKNIWELFKFFGPFGLFLIWLFVVMLPFVMGFRLLQFIRALFIKFINFILTILDWILKLWGALPLT